MDGLEEELDALERVICCQKEPDSLDFRLLRRLTGNFSDDRRIGEGGCGKVYKGFLPNGKVIAVKKLKKYHIIDEKMFLREVDSMIKVQHQNIVRFLGYCSEIKEKAVLMDDGNYVMAEEREKLLCFPYISNGSLDKHLTDELRGFEWHTRYQIIKGICDGLLHLHKEKGIMHMDLKPANILLDDQMVPKITDFGVSRIDGKTQITSAERLFSRGHAAPEYIDAGLRSWKSDIYSLGVIMIELVTGSRKIPNTTKVLRRWRHRWNKSSKHTPLSYLQVKKCLELAVSCQEKNPVNRPFIWDLVCELDKLDSWDGRIRESSIEKIIFSPDDMLGTEPLELHFTLAHDMKQISCSIELTNDTDYYMAFRIARTSLLPFSIQPAKGIASPRSKCTTSITLSVQEMTPLLHNLGEEGFIVQSTRIDGSFTAVDITDDTFNDEGGNSQVKNGDGDKVVDEVNLTVLFDEMLHKEHRKDVANLSAEMGSLGTSSQEGLHQSVLEGAYSNQQNHMLRGAGARGPYGYSQSQEYHAESSTAAATASRNSGMDKQITWDFEYAKQLQQEMEDLCIEDDDATASRNSGMDKQIAWDFEYAKQLQKEMEDLSVEDDDDISCVPFPSDSVDERDHHDEEEEADGQDGNGDDDPDNMTCEQRQALVESVGTNYRGLSDELISYLEPWKYKAVKASGFFSRKTNHEDCPICLSTFRSRETMITLPCWHHYHAACVTKWLKVCKTCPVCKYELFGPSEHPTVSPTEMI